MRSALLCVFFALIIHEEVSQASSSNDFRPIPIPLDHWNYEKREGRVETLQDTINTEKPSSVVAVPAHYWEDALRHSVYLTLVRDKIDQLISKGLVVSHDTKLDHYESKEIDDHDLWEKIKNAPFDRIEAEDQPSFGDITIMAKGRLVEDNGGYRFTEDKQTKGNCTEDKCLEGVKAFWSVKRIRQRDEEVSPGRHHYELTFSVNSQKTKKKKKPHETPIRTFTVRESPPEIIASTPQEQLYHQTARPEMIRPQRAIWFHRNIVPPTSHSQARYHHHGLERIFSSFFSDDDEPVERPRHKPNPFMSPYPQFSKFGYMGLPSDQHQHKKLMPYPYKPHYYKYGRPPLQAPPLSHSQHHYFDVDAFNNPHDLPPTDHRYISPSNIVKTTRPAVLPTPPVTNDDAVSDNITLDANSSNGDNVTENIVREPETITVYRPHHKPRPTQMNDNVTENIVREPEIITAYRPHHKSRPTQTNDNFTENIVREPEIITAYRPHHKSRPTQMNDNFTENIVREPEIITAYRPYHKTRPTQTKINYFPEHIRPPVYNAPPGVFGPMDKKPFKPMPPLKHMHSTKPFKRPSDFRPSPQFTDGHFSHQDETVDTAFRPILINFTDTGDQEKINESQDDTHTVRKQVPKKPPKKHEIIKSQRFTTSAPDIITVNNEFYFNDTIQWAKYLGAFTKTTPMEPEKETQKAPETSTEPISLYSSTVYFKSSTDYIEESPKMTTTTSTTTQTPAPKKRTRPPHKFAKPEKVKKHKRVTTTTSTIAPEIPQTKKTSDLTPQASSAATGANKNWQPKNKTTTTTTTTTTSSPIPSSTTSSTTTPKPPTSTTQITHTTTNTPVPTTSSKIEEISTPAQEKSKNRYRQSTLMLKGTSVKHDRWSITPATVTEKKITAATSGKQPPRRKGSNFQGYGPQKHLTHEGENNDQLYTGYTTEISKRQETSTSSISENTRLSTQPNYEETADQYNVNSEPTSEYSENQNDEYQKNEDDDEHDDIEVKVKNDDEQESEDHAEFIFDLTSTTPNDKSNEINEEESTVTEQTVVAASHSVSKNKTRCKKKKKNDHLTPTKESVTEDEPAPTTTIATTTKSSGLDILDELLGNLSYEPPKPKETKSTELDEEGSENHEKYLNIDDDFEDFLVNLEDRNRHTDESQKDVEEEDYDEDEEKEPIEDDVSPFDNDDVNESSRNTNDKEYEDYHDRSYSLLELMAME